jgi:hypothetical protein
MDAAMMGRFLRFVFTLFLAVCALLLTIVLVLHFNRGWQRDLVVQALEDRTGMEWSMEEAYFTGANRFRAQQVFALKGSEGVEVKALDLKFNLGRSLGMEEVVISEGVLIGLFIDLSTMPAEALGFTAGQLQSGVPTRAETMQATRMLTEFALMRLEASGLVIELEQTAVTGSVLFPANRWLSFDLTIQHGRSDSTDAMRMEVHSAEFR